MQLVTFTQILVAHSSLPFGSVAELIAYSKTNPGKVTYAAFGVGSPYLLSEMLKVRAGADLLHVPYKGIPQAVTAVVSGETHLTWSSPFSIIGHVKGGKLKALAIAAGKRHSLMPDVPTLEELGWPDIDYVQWFGLLAPGATPRATVQRIYGDFAKVIADPELQSRELAAKGFDPSGLGPEPFAALIRREVALRGEMVRRTGAKGD